jgi:hypothetical protein
MQALQAAVLVIPSLDRLDSLRSISLKCRLSRSQWKNDEHRVNSFINSVITKFESMPSLTGGRCREVRLLFEDGETEVFHVEGKAQDTSKLTDADS